MTVQVLHTQTQILPQGFWYDFLPPVFTPFSSPIDTLPSHFFQELLYHFYP